MTTVYDRRSGQLIDEPQFGEHSLRLLYGHRWLRPLTNALITRRWVSQLLTWPERRPRSAARVPEFVRRYGVDLADYPERAYASFADFFTRDFRESARPVDPDPTRLVAPADAKLRAYPVADARTVAIKGFDYTIPALLGREAASSPRWCLVFRLTVDDGHRYCFVDDCQVVDSYELPGKLHTVGPWSDGRARVLTENHRVVSTLDTAHFGQVTVVEVGALLVGRIVNHPVTRAARGQEKGYFAYGGSTIVLLVDDLTIDADIVEHSHAGIETKVCRGEGIGSRP